MKKIMILLAIGFISSCSHSKREISKSLNEKLCVNECIENIFGKVDMTNKKIRDNIYYACIETYKNNCCIERITEKGSLDYYDLGEITGYLECNGRK